MKILQIIIFFSLVFTRSFADNLLDDVVLLSKENISVEIINSYIDTKYFPQKLSVQNIIFLKKEKVDDQIITRLIKKSNDDFKKQFLIDNINQIREHNDYINFQKNVLLPRSRFMRDKNYK